MAKAWPIEQARQMSCFVGGLRESIRTNVRANKPHTLSVAIRLAKLYEARDQSQCQSNQPTIRATPTP